jgi:hypothetical protein
LGVLGLTGLSSDNNTQFVNVALWFNQGRGVRGGGGGGGLGSSILKFGQICFWSKYIEKNFLTAFILFPEAQAAQSYPVLLITLYLYILKIIRKSCVINLLRYIFI